MVCIIEYEHVNVTYTEVWLVHMLLPMQVLTKVTVIREIWHIYVTIRKYDCQYGLLKDP